MFKPYGFREWLARRLLNAAYGLARTEWPAMYDGQRGWKFDLRWKQETLGEKLRRCLDH